MNEFIIEKSVGKNLHEALGENYKALRLFLHALEVFGSVEKGVEGVENPLATR